MTVLVLSVTLVLAVAIVAGRVLIAVVLRFALLDVLERLADNAPAPNQIASS